MRDTVGVRSLGRPDFSSLAWTCALALGLCGLLGSAAYACRAAWHWPLVGDAALMHYVVFLLHAGRAPYSQIVDINLPGTYLLEASAMRLFGAGARGLRLYDTALCLVATALCMLLSEPGWTSRLCGLGAGMLFLLVHLRDGVIQAGQRDLALGVLVLLALAVLLRGRWLSSLAALGIFELLVGVTLTVKPTLLPLALLPFLVTRPGAERRPGIRDGLLGLSCLLLPSLAVLAWLQHRGSVPALLWVLRWVVPSHRGLGSRGLPFLVGHSVAPLGVVLLLGVALFLWLKLYRGGETRVLLFGLGCGLLSFVVQGKGFPYQRYPFLLLACLLLFRALAQAMEASVSLHALAVAVLLLLGLGVAPRFAATVASYNPAAPFQDALAAELQHRGAGQAEVQCLDTVGGCVSTLYRLGLVQSTGFLYDCYAYAGMAGPKNQYRRAFLEALETARPRYIVLTSQFCLQAAGKLDRVAEWTSLETFLDTEYRPVGTWEPERRVRWWNQWELPPGYVLFGRR